MIKLTNFQQNSQEWLDAKAGVPSASELHNLVSPEWKIRTGEGPLSYLAVKLGEWWSGKSDLFDPSFAMQQGSIIEEECRPFLEIALNCEIETVGLLKADDESFCCSPDGLIVGQDCGLEIKAPQNKNHILYLLDGGCPKDYRAQVQGGMFVTGFDRWRFVSYRRRFPMLSVIVERDEKAQNAIAEALDGFRERFEEGKALLIQKNGGKLPRRFDPPPPQTGRPYWETEQKPELQEVGPV